jgi:superfamily I DNA and RNA helicase
MEFIGSEYDTDAPGSEAELEVWESLKDSFDSSDTGVAYYKYPIVDKSGGRFDQEPDFVIFHKELGLVIIECKGFEIDNIDRIDGYEWNLDGVSYERTTPSEKARQQGFHLRSFFDRRPELLDEQQNNVVNVNWFVALPNISREEWESRGFHQIPSSPKVITGDEMSPQTFRDRIFGLDTTSSLTGEQYVSARSILSGGNPISGGRKPPTGEAEDKKALYNHVTEGLKQLDKKQEEFSVEIPPGPQQVRGIAGSGKTVLMARKAARMHLRHPDWNIALTFFTKSLYQQITQLVHDYYWQAAEEKPDWDKIEIMHGWGGRTTLDGLYYTLAMEAGEDPRAPSSAEELTEEHSPPELLDACCEELLESSRIPSKYDAILIDEAQDFEPNFYEMCRRALKEPERLIWAYDEAQSLGSLDAPSPVNIFGKDEDDEPVVDLRGTYEGGIQKSKILRRSYRAPREILMVGHAFGMGLNRDAGAVQAITEKEGWENIGYEVLEGDFRRTGEPVKITRPPEKSPHPLQDRSEAKPFVTLNEFDDKEEEIEYVAEQIRKDIEDEGLNPEDIMVVTLAGKGGDELTESLDEKGIEAYRVWEDTPEEDTIDEGSVFTQPGKVSIAGINRAKGNEAGSVYVLGINEVENPYRSKGAVQRRNEAFVAITRSRAWCQITGVDYGNGVIDEVEEIIDQIRGEGEPILEFPAPNPKELENEMEEDGLRNSTLDSFV